MKIVTILGCRPQFIKSAVVSEELKKAGCEEVTIHTGQHYDHEMSDVFFKQLGLNRPKYNLSVGGYSHGRMTGLMLKRIESVLINERPDFVLVYGDTNSTLAASIAAAKLGIKIAHVEAGLRSFDKHMPEEINRIVTDRISDYLFCPNKESASLLWNEGIRENVFTVGDVMYDVLLRYLPQTVETDKSNPYNYVTIHRQENTTDVRKLTDILNVFMTSGQYFIMPLHPRTRKLLEREKINKPDNVVFLSPMSYIENLNCMKSANRIITDSGGIQKEAYMLGVPCITLRDNTEWTETVAHGWNVLVGTNTDKLELAIKSSHVPYNKPDIFGDGTASKKVVKILCQM